MALFCLFNMYVPGRVNIKVGNPKENRNKIFEFVFQNRSVWQVNQVHLVLSVFHVSHFQWFHCFSSKNWSHILHGSFWVHQFIKLLLFSWNYSKLISSRDRSTGRFKNNFLGIFSNPQGLWLPRELLWTFVTYLWKFWNRFQKLTFFLYHNTADSF